MFDFFKEIIEKEMKKEDAFVLELAELQADFHIAVCELSKKYERSPKKDLYHAAQSIQNLAFEMEDN